ncbi:hypothetical protein NIES3974_13390 [Calothrix sp. NIES-3974]|nr:hypothetical protein NIES3974_13390 [Calothrix sp. NIES-3974]
MFTSGEYMHTFPASLQQSETQYIASLQIQIYLSSFFFSTSVNIDLEDMLWV